VDSSQSWGHGWNLKCRAERVLANSVRTLILPEALLSVVEQQSIRTTKPEIVYVILGAMQDCKGCSESDGGAEIAHSTSLDRIVRSTLNRKLRIRDLDIEAARRRSVVSTDTARAVWP